MDEHEESTQSDDSPGATAVSILIALSAFAVFIGVFLDWVRTPIVSINGFDATFGYVVAIIAIVLIVIAVVSRSTAGIGIISYIGPILLGITYGLFIFIDRYFIIEGQSVQVGDGLYLTLFGSAIIILLTVGYFLATADFKLSLVGVSILLISVIILAGIPYYAASDDVDRVEVTGMQTQIEGTTVVLDIKLENPTDVRRLVRLTTELEINGESQAGPRYRASVRGGESRELRFEFPDKQVEPTEWSVVDCQLNSQPPYTCRTEQYTIELWLRRVYF